MTKLPPASGPLLYTGASRGTDILRYRAPSWSCVKPSGGYWDDNGHFKRLLSSSPTG